MASSPVIEATPKPATLAVCCSCSYGIPGNGQTAALKMLPSESMDLFEQHRAKTPPPSVSASPLPAQPKGGGISGSLLIVDDDDAVRSFVCVATRRLGYQVVEAANGVEALNQVEQNPGKISLVLTDVNMPLMDGIALVKAGSEC